MRIKLIVTSALVLVLTACGGGEGDGLASALKLNDDPASILLMVRDEGGFVPPDFQVRQGPRLILLRDGTLITPGAVPAIYPGPMVTHYQRVLVDEETLLFVMEELDSLGFTEIEAEINNEAAEFIADASTTVVTFYNQDGTHRFGVYGLGLGDLAPGSEFDDTRVPQLANLVAQIENAGFSTAGGLYEPDSIQVLAGMNEFLSDPAFANSRPWPLSVRYEEMAESGLPGWRCASFQGDEATTLMAEFNQANQETTWDDGSTAYSMAVRPLFPGEEACAHLMPAA